MTTMTCCHGNDIGDGPISGRTFDEERALYNLHGAVVENCRFSGPADGESALKECRDVTVRGCDFDLRYPMWHADGFSMGGCKMSDTCRAPLWYARNGMVSDTLVNGVKCLRECDDVTVNGCTVDSPEFGWKCRRIKVRDCDISSEYIFLDSSDLDISELRMRGKYSFQYIRNAVIENSTLETKDAFWHSRDVTVRNCELKGEYLGWYSENLTLIGCRISGTQPLCYCRNLRLIDCTMEGTDLSFEYSDVQADIVGNIESVKNPRSGRIHAGSIGDLVLSDQVIECKCEVITEDGVMTWNGPVDDVQRSEPVGSSR